MKVDLSIYRGYINNKELVISGHIFKSWAPSQYSIQQPSIKHAMAIFKMFNIKPLKNVSIRFEFKDLSVTTKSLDDGYFSFRVPFSEALESGWHSCSVSHKIGEFNIIANSELLKPFDGTYGIISDIDDTFLISHSSNIFKKLFVMLTQNINKRKIFEDVPEHYQALSAAGQTSEAAANSFFYVSSSEWNLYSFIVAIAKKYQLPKAVILLKKIKTGIGDFVFTGGGSHDHKFEKIKDIISFYPNLQYVLLGDDSQKDPFLYERICKVFPKNIKAIYIRQTRKNQKQNVVETLNNISDLGVETLYFTNSKNAIVHSKDIGIIK
ncbi:App1 family protein [Sediminibacter sp. Hel_I_10]|uniref:App1 family protein n=1 Tax=Sediminibacter sp. Hel_I_10 TaxID=1392490 RepID=UPI00047979CB|nr:App1 family protein [Sediminibacter sp. Hel_I_10]